MFDMPVLNFNIPTFSVLLGLSSEGPLIDLALFGSRERQSVGL